MELPTTVEWALHSTWLLAQAPNGTAVPTRRLAEFHGVPQDYLAKALKALVRADVLAATPGPRGGYRLARAPQEISVYEIVAALDGRKPMFRCQEIRQNGPCPLPAEECHHPCGISTVMRDAEQAWRTKLQQTTVADLVEHASDASTERARQWFNTEVPGS